MAMACLRLVTFLPERPLLSLPRLRSCIARFTFCCAFFPYRAICLLGCLRIAKSRGRHYFNPASRILLPPLYFAVVDFAAPGSRLHAALFDEFLEIVESRLHASAEHTERISDV